MAKMTLTKILNIFVLALFLCTVCETVFSQEQEIIEFDCSQSTQGSLTLTFGVDHKLDENNLLNAVHLHVIESVRPFDLGIYAFYNGKQIDTNLLHQLLKCGDRYTIGFSVPLDDIEKGVIHIFTREHPTVPSQISLALPKEQFIEFAFIYDDVNTYRLNDRSLPASDMANMKVGNRVPIVEGLGDGYFYTGDDPSIPEAQSYYRILNSGETFSEFKIYFPNSTDQKDIFSITCLMDGQQFDAFDNDAVWSGELESGEAMLLDGIFSAPSESGWHQLRCLVLNNLYGEAEQVSENIYTIAAMYIYQP
jgi:hypothetical protein